MDKRWTFFSADFELGSHCATGCRFCPHDRLTRGHGQMDLGLFRKLAPRLAAQHVRLTFCGMGNPLSNPRWPEFISSYRELGGFCGIVVHARELTDAVIADLLEHGPNVVEVSFPSVDPDVFAVLCPKVTYDVALERAEALISAAGRCFAVVPIGIQTEINPHESGRATAFWKDRGVTARVNPLHSRGGNLDDDELGTFAAAGLDKPCGLLAMHAFVAWNGDLLACCHDLSGDTVMGNVFVDDLDELMDRKQAVLDRLPHVGLCTTCTDAYRLNPVPARPFPETRSARRKALKRLV